MNINDMTGTQVAANFAEFYNVEQIFQDYEDWKADPRLVPAHKFTDWLIAMCGEDYTRTAEGQLVRKLDSAMDEEGYMDANLPYFEFIRAGSGVKGYHKILSFRDYSILTVNELASKDNKRIEIKRRKTKQIITRVKEYYGDNVPAEILATESRLDMVYDFQKEVSMIFDGMIKTQTRALSEVQDLKALENKMEELTDEVEKELGN